MNDPIIRTARQIGADVLHGIESHGALSFNNTNHTLSVATDCVYWINGVRVNAGPVTCDIDDYETLTTNKLYYFFFDDTTGTLKCADSAWSINTSSVPVATVYWNGSLGAVCEETHGYQRDLQWHIWAHLTVGARISSSDFSMTTPSVASPTTVNFSGGTLYDEDHASAYTNNDPAGMLQNCRVWYQTGAATYTFENSNSIYPTGGVSFVDSDATPNYTLTAINTNQYANAWIYAAPDIDRPIYVFLETRTSAHSTAAAARAINPPSLVNMGIQQELKLLYRVIMQGNETFTESTDYRSSASLPAGGTTAPTASAVIFTPAGNLSSTSVQTAIEELDTEKASATHGHQDRIVAVFDGGGSAIADAKKVYVYVPWACTINDWTILADQSGTISIDVWKYAYSGYAPGTHPVNADSITGGNNISLSSASKNQDLDVTNWAANPQTITAGDVLCFCVEGAATSITWCTVVLTVTRSA